MKDFGELSEQRKSLLADARNLLVLGGPGSGKTTIALLKADREGGIGRLGPGRKILFLSFARATIARVAQEAGKLVDVGALNTLEINTYHGFVWKLLRSHGYLLHVRGRIKLLPPPQAAAHLAEIADDAGRDAEKRRLFDEEGILHFDLFADAAAGLLSRSRALRTILTDAYPIIILDEFQDTNAAEWAFIQQLGVGSRLIALADPDQRIYEFRGADPKRIGEFTDMYKPQIYDFAGENHRSDGRDIIVFGNDLLSGVHRGKKYKDVSIVQYGFYHGRNMLFPLKGTVLQRAKALHKSKPKAWALAVLVPTKRMMLQVSDYLGAVTDGLPELPHDVAMDAEGPSLAAAVIAALLEGGADSESVAQQLIADLCAHIRGRRGNEPPPQGDLGLVGALGRFLTSGQVRGAKRQRIIEGAKAIAAARMGLTLSGDPEHDWLAVRHIVAASGIAEYEQVAEDSRYLRLLHKGALLRSRLGELWRQHGSYRGASAAVEGALLQEHFSAGVRDWRGIHVMTMHKSKGKQFDEVVIFEGTYGGRFLRADADERDTAQAVLALRVGATRSESRTTILTPAGNPSPLL